MSNQGPRDQEVTNGAAHVALPQNSFGVTTIGEIDNNTASSTISFANGLKGVTVKVFPVTAPWDAGTPVSTVTHMRVAFNNTAYDDVDVPGGRHLIPMGEERTFVFDQTPLPTEMYIAPAIAGAAGAESAVNESYTVYTATHN